MPGYSLWNQERFSSISAIRGLVVAVMRMACICGSDIDSSARWFARTGHAEWCSVFAETMDPKIGSLKALLNLFAF